MSRDRADVPAIESSAEEHKLSSGGNFPLGFNGPCSCLLFGCLRGQHVQRCPRVLLWSKDPECVRLVRSCHLLRRLHSSTYNYRRPYGPRKVGVVVMLYPVFLTVYSFYTVERSENLHLRTQPETIVDFMVTIPVFCFAYQMHEIVVPVYACMNKRGIIGFTKALTAALVFLLMAYVTVGCFGYATYGYHVKPNIMQMFEASDPAVLFGIVALMIKMVVTYPLIVFFGREELDSMYIRFYHLSAEEANKGERKRTFIALAIWFLAPMLLAVLPIDLGIALKFLGCLSMLNIYIFPGLCLVGVIHKKPGYLPRERLMHFLGCVVVIFGMVLSGLVFVETIVHHMPKSGASNQCS
ncbi:sodium-coupled neutral amino acid transporter 7-like isoform X3 [Ornithodoros turicata]|uniref:sodium-coupled neutral amino acid transporter 7-like isoform X3 n=1 Tax=Ornithodoros turicata TaxID=34597 RepID=UPI003139B290